MLRLEIVLCILAVALLARWAASPHPPGGLTLNGLSLGASTEFVKDRFGRATLALDGTWIYRTRGATLTLAWSGEKRLLAVQGERAVEVRFDGRDLPGCGTTRVQVKQIMGPAVPVRGQPNRLYFRREGQILTYRFEHGRVTSVQILPDFPLEEIPAPGDKHP